MNLLRKLFGTLRKPAPTALPSRPRLAVAAIFRNECPYVIEWLAHHRVLGVSAFYIADNVSDDGTSELLAALDELGYLKRIVFPSPPGKAPQLLAYTEIMSRHASHEDWVALIDADEFIVPTDDARSIIDRLEQLAADGTIGAVALNWAVYGSSGQAKAAMNLVIERFEHHAVADFWVNHHYKSVVRMRAYRSTHGNPHLFELSQGWRYAHTDGRDVVHHEKRGPGVSQSLVWDGLRLNHYVIKSREEFDQRKRPKGSATVIGRTKGDDYFRAHDRNEVPEPLPAWLRDAVRTEVQRIEAALAQKSMQLTT